MGEVKPQSVFVNKRTRLLHMAAKHLTKSILEKMGGRVVSRNALSSFNVDR